MGLGMSLRDIPSHIKQMYDTNISHTVLSQITDRIIPDIKTWQSRPLEPLYCVVWLDAMHYKVKVDGKIKLVYLATKNIEKKWTSPLQNWSLTVQQFLY